MEHGWFEVDRLTDILEAEFNGHVIDSAEAHGLAARIARLYPDVAQTMSLVMNRMAERGAGSAAA